MLLIISDKCARKSSDTPLIHHFSLSNQILEYFAQKGNLWLPVQYYCIRCLSYILLCMIYTC